MTDGLEHDPPDHDPRELDPRFLDPLRRGPLASPREPFVTLRRLVRALLRGLLLGGLLALLGALGGARGALAGALVGLVALAVAWVEFWAERRDGSERNDALAFAAASAAAALGFLLAHLQWLYLDALLRGRGPAGGMSAIGDELRGFTLQTLWAFSVATLLPATAFGLSVLQRLRRYLPPALRRSIPAGVLALVLLLALGAGAAARSALGNAAAALLCSLLAVLPVWYLFVALLGAIYRWADELELELHLWRARRAEP